MGGKARGSREEKVLLVAREQAGQDQDLGHQRDGSCSRDKARGTDGVGFDRRDTTNVLRAFLLNLSNNHVMTGR